MGGKGGGGEANGQGQSLEVRGDGCKWGGLPEVGGVERPWEV